MDELKERIALYTQCLANTFVFNGNSMDDGTSRTIADQDQLHCQRIEDVGQGIELNRAYVIVSRGGVLVRQITKCDAKEGIISCHAYNSAYTDTEIATNDIIELFDVRFTTRNAEHNRSLQCDKVSESVTRMRVNGI